jgi:hypothetical protein
VFTMLVIAGSMPPRLNPNEVRSKKALCGLLCKARDRSPAPLLSRPEPMAAG